MCERTVSLTGASRVGGTRVPVGAVGGVDVGVRVDGARGEVASAGEGSCHKRLAGAPLTRSLTLATSPHRGEVIGACGTLDLPLPSRTRACPSSAPYAGPSRIYPTRAVERSAPKAPGEGG